MEMIDRLMATNLRLYGAGEEGFMGGVVGLPALVDALLMVEGLLIDDNAGLEEDHGGKDFVGNIKLPTSNPTKNIDK